MLPFKSLDHVTGSSSATGSSKDLETVGKAFTIVVEFSGTPGPTAGTVVLQGSLDRVVWIDLASITPTAPVVVATVDGPNYFRFVRASMSGISGGAYEVVTATIAPVVVE